MTKTKKIWIFWGLLYLICMVCGFVPNPQGGLYGLFVLLSVAFFIPPAYLLYCAVQWRSKKIMKQVRLLSILSLSLSFVMILVNLLAVQASEAWGTALYWILIVVSAPMICGQAWVIGLFGWACLLMTTIMFAPKK